MTVKRFKRRNAAGATVKVTQRWKNQKHLDAEAAVDHVKAEIHALEAKLKALLPRSQRGLIEEDCAAARGAVCTLVNRKLWDRFDDPGLPLLVMYSEESEDDDGDDDGLVEEAQLGHRPSEKAS